MNTKIKMKIDAYILKHEKWLQELNLLRDILLDAGLEENFKWSYPVYSFDNKNIISLGAFKNHCALWFFQGVYLKDDYKLLRNAQESTKAMRQIRIEKDFEINITLVKEYILEAIENQKKGLEMKPDRKASFDLSEELEKVLKSNKDLASAFKTLSPSKQKEYSNYISSAKQEKTKNSRLEKIIPMILDGKGLHDKYKNC